MSIMDRADSSETDEFLTFEEMKTRFYEWEPRAAAEVDCAALTHRGNVRENNEDHYLVVRRARKRDVLLTSMPQEILPPSDVQHAYTLAVADGMGGHNFGELASLTALRTGWLLGGDEVKWTVKVNERERQELEEKADVFFRLLHRALVDATIEDPQLHGMGTTLTLCYTTGRELFVMHAGDSRAYLFRNGNLRRLTRDHTVAQLLIDSGTAAPDSPEVRRARHRLTSGLGSAFQDITIDFSRFLLSDKDRLLLCTDGLTDMLPDKEIAAILDKHASPSEACQALVDAALERGGKDNVTVIVASYRYTETTNPEPV